jgi:hypothetical protein
MSEEMSIILVFGSAFVILTILLLISIWWTHKYK